MMIKKLKKGSNEMRRKMIDSRKKRIEKDEESKDEYHELDHV